MSLTDDYNSKKLKKGWYWVKFNCYVHIVPAFYEKGYFCSDGKVEEVVAPCDYEELLRFKRENVDLQVGADSLRELNKIMRRNYDNKVDSLRELLKKCKLLFEAEKKFLVKCSRMEDIDDILIRINAAIGEEKR